MQAAKGSDTYLNPEPQCPLRPDSQVQVCALVWRAGEKTGTDLSLGLILHPVFVLLKNLVRSNMKVLIVQKSGLGLESNLQHLLHS